MNGLRVFLALAITLAALPMLAAPAPALAADPGYRMWIDPATQNVHPDGEFTVRVRFASPEGANSIGLDLGFDPAAVQITDIALGAAFPAGATLMPPMPAAIAAANLDGSLEGIAAMTPFGVWVPAGEREGLIITMRARGEVRTSPLTIAKPIIGRYPDFRAMTPAVTPGEVRVVPRPVVPPPPPPPPLPDLVVVAARQIRVGDTDNYTVNFTVRNIGGVASTPTSVSIIIDGRDAQGIFLPALRAADPLADLLPGEKDLGSTVFNVTAHNATARSNTITIHVDKAGLVRELNEKNNSVTLQPDLIVTEVVPRWVTNITTNVTHYVPTFRIQNIGTGIVFPNSTADVRVRIRPLPTPAVPVPGWVYLPARNVTVGVLGPGAITTLKEAPPEIAFNVTAHAEHEIRVRVDIPPPAAGVVAEIHEVNNERTITTGGVVGRPDAAVEVIGVVLALPEFARIMVPTVPRMTLIRGETTTISVPVVVHSDVHWQLQAREDPIVGLPGRMSMVVDNVTTNLTHPMFVVHGAVRADLTAPRIVAAGTTSQMLDVRLEQTVHPRDPHGNFEIDVQFTLFATW
jgi:hypothetical protein